MAEESGEFSKSFWKAVGYTVGGTAVLAGLGALCVVCPPVGIAAAKLTAAGAAAAAGKDVSGVLSS